MDMYRIESVEKASTESLLRKSGFVSSRLVSFEGIDFMQIEESE